MWEERAYRARRDITALAAEGLGVSDLHAAAIRLIEAKVGTDLTCWATIDPENLVISTMTSGDSRIPWEYEPRTFVLEEEEGRVVEAFTPDFYLPEQDLYVEITVMKQSLVTRKNRKLRKLRERYPDVNAKLFYKRDISRLAERYRLDLAS